MLDILIPTYNRASYLRSNLDLMYSQVMADKLEDKINIIISDNHSTDETYNIAERFKKEHSTLNIALFQQEENVGLERNTVFVLSQAKSNYVMFLGDDDFLPGGYLSFCFQQLNSVNNLGCIIPGNLYINPEADKNIKRAGDFDPIMLEPGFESMLKIGSYGHQMSGILFKREQLLESYLKSDSRNIYLFIYFALFCIQKYRSIYAPKFTVEINTTNAKDWSYDQTGLLAEVYKSYYPFIFELGEQRVVDLIVDFTVKQSFRLGINPLHPIKSLKSFKGLLRDIRKLKGLRGKLYKLYVKDYIYRAIPVLNPYK
jgi:abequosyltransferase